MKFTKGQLRRIISEEITKHLKEMEDSVGAEIDQMPDEGTHPLDQTFGSPPPPDEEYLGFNIDGRTFLKVAEDNGMTPKEFLKHLGFDAGSASRMLMMMSFASGDSMMPYLK